MLEDIENNITRDELEKYKSEMYNNFISVSEL